LTSFSVMLSTCDQEAQRSACLDNVQWSDFGERRRVALNRAAEIFKYDLKYDADRNLNHYCQKSEEHAILVSGALFQRGRRIRFTDLTLHPWAQLLRIYLLKAGLLAHLQDLVLSGLSGYMLSTYIELWEPGIRLQGEGASI